MVKKILVLSLLMVSVAMSGCGGEPTVDLNVQPPTESAMNATNTAIALAKVTTQGRAPLVAKKRNANWIETSAITMKVLGETNQMERELGSELPHNVC